LRGREIASVDPETIDDDALAEKIERRSITMTKRKEKWVLVLDNRSALDSALGRDHSCAVGPFDSEEKAREYANSTACDYDGYSGMHVMMLLGPGVSV
jgi:hypothetical protein